jgi:hypothetical protein
MYDAHFKHFVLNGPVTCPHFLRVAVGMAQDSVNQEIETN